MKNTPVILDGKTVWLSRSLAASCYVYTYINGHECVLANKRGSAPGIHNPNKWNVPGGFLDYDETLEEAACREVWEETGIEINQKRLTLIKIDSEPNRSDQVVLAIYGVILTGVDTANMNLTPSAENCEPNEVAEVEWVKLSEIDNYDWVSERHKERIIDVFHSLIRIDF